MDDLDVIVIGAGHNGLTCAAYLARAGLKVRVVERRAMVGGAAVTEEFSPGFRNSTAAYTVGLLNPTVIRDLDLHAHGLRIVERRAMNFLPGADGQYLLTRAGALQQAIARISPADAERYPAYAREIDTVADVLRSLLLRTPPNLTRDGPWARLREAVQALRLGLDLRALDFDGVRALHDLMSRSAGDYLDAWLHVRSGQGPVRLRRRGRQPCEPLHARLRLCAAPPLVRRGQRPPRRLGPCDRGMGAVSEAIASAARAAGAGIDVSSPVREVIVEGGRARGVVLADGTTLRARSVAANVDPKRLYTRLVPAGALPADFSAASAPIGATRRPSG